VAQGAKIHDALARPLHFRQQNDALFDMASTCPFRQSCGLPLATAFKEGRPIRFMQMLIDMDMNCTFTIQLPALASKIAHTLRSQINE
jgi:hypothetical protein